MISDERVHVMDGAMGTELYNRGVFVNVCYDQLNLTKPDLVRSVHEEYVAAGAEIIETNTFGANPVKLSGFGLDDRTEELNSAAAKLAIDACAGKAAVVGAIGPLGIRIEPYGPTSQSEAVELFTRQAQGLLDGGVDGFVLETFSDVEEIHAAYRGVRELSDLPIIAQMSFGEDGNTSYGTSVETAAQKLTHWGADVIGLNCSVGPAAMLDAVERLARATDVPISAQPNAGLPRNVGDRKIYLAAPEYMARYARRMIEAGARYVGGCCGTTPEHVKKIADFVASVQPRQTSVYISSEKLATPAGTEPIPLAERSNWGKKIACGTFVTSVEVIPPRGWIADDMIDQCRFLKEAGVDAVNVLDGPRAQSRMGVLPASLIIEREVGVEVLMSYTCRDRNMLGMISDLLGAAAAGLHNIIIVTGDPPLMGPYDFTGVFDIDSIGLTNVVCQLNRGLDPGGNAIGEATRYAIGVAVNPGAVDMERELKRFAWKVDAGAEFAVTQPVFDIGAFGKFLKRIEDHRIPIIAGVWPLRSLRGAEFLANEVPGVVVPKFVLDRMQAAQDRGEDFAAAEGLAIAREVLSQVRECAGGVQVSAPASGTHLAIELLSGT
ncbi:MAG: bifunctional homocysteine S-methyltransferase/methylenetetrahydrofolate reductase [Gemmatimonadales bacterium]